MRKVRNNDHPLTFWTQNHLLRFDTVSRTTAVPSFKSFRRLLKAELFSRAYDLHLAYLARLWLFLQYGNEWANIKIKVASSLDRHLQSWTASLYNLGSGSWLAFTAVPRRMQWQPRARSNGPQYAASRHTTPQSTTLGLHPVIHVPNYMHHYSFTDPWGMDGWVGHVGWPIADGLTTKWSPSSLAQDRESSPAEASVLTTMLRCQLYNITLNY